MAITSEIIGKLGGGADVQTVEISGVETNGGDITLHTVEVEEGEQVLALFVGQLSRTPTSVDTYATFKVGNSEMRAFSGDRDVSVAAVLSTTGDIVINGSGGVSRTGLAGGHVYTVKL